MSRVFDVHVINLLFNWFWGLCCSGAPNLGPIRLQHFGDAERFTAETWKRDEDQILCEWKKKEEETFPCREKSPAWNHSTHFGLARFWWSPLCVKDVKARAWIFSWFLIFLHLLLGALTNISTEDSASWIIQHPSAHTHTLSHPPQRRYATAEKQKSSPRLCSWKFLISFLPVIRRIPRKHLIYFYVKAEIKRAVPACTSPAAHKKRIGSFYCIILYFIQFNLFLFHFIFCSCRG